jgi:hypothetical protein
MIKKIATVMWEMAEFYKIRLPFAHIVFGLMIGSKGKKKK